VLSQASVCYLVLTLWVATHLNASYNSLKELISMENKEDLIKDMVEEIQRSSNKLTEGKEEIQASLDRYLDDMREAFDRLDTQLDRIEDSMNGTLEKVTGYEEKQNEIKDKLKQIIAGLER
jgi:DNA anti-recombination protein RmuC